MDKNQGYAILKAVMLENGRGFALGEHPTAPSRYVTWACYDDKDGQRQYEWGHYGNDRTAMEQDFADRVQDYQRIYNVGINIRRTRTLLLVATGLLTATTTAFCGPISFIGLAVPHIARLMLGTSNHNSLLPVTMLTGGAIALLCNFICILPGEAGIIPLNAVTPVIGAPIIIYVIVNQRKIQYFN